MHRQNLIRASQLASRVALFRDPITSRAALTATRLFPSLAARGSSPRWRSTTASARRGIHHQRRRALSSSSAPQRGIMPDTETPTKQTPPASPEPSWGVVELSESRFHDIADEYLENVLARFEALQDTREDIDVEYSSGVMTIGHAAKGTYVINKQPPNKQIWLSSPQSGPKRYDWCVVGEGQADKEGTGEGSWIYARDGTCLNDLILDELGVDVSPAATAES